jgi:site-specific recombinase XerC
MTALPAIAIEAATPALPVADIEAATAFARQEKAASTRKAYRSDFALFRAWCLAKGVPALPASPESVAAYLAHEAAAGRAASTITRRCAAIRYAHRLADLDPPTHSEKVRATLRGIRRTIGAAPARKAPVLADTARAMALSVPDGLKGLRDRALLLLGFAGAFRRSELVALDVADLEETDEGLRVTIRQSKTDQEGHGQVIAIARGSSTCPVKAIKAWLEASGITEGPLFRPVAKGGHLAFGGGDSLPLMQAGNIKAYAMTSDRRMAIAPDIPTFAEMGLPTISYSQWFGLFAPRRTPRPIISKLNAVAMEAMADPEVRSRLGDLGMEIFPRERQTPEALAALVEADAEKWWPIMRQFGIKAD